MSDFIDRRTRFWAGVAVVVGVALFFGLELQDEPMTPLELALELVKIVPGVLVGVGVVLLFRMSYQQREEQLALLRDLEVARLQGQRWRNESRALLAGLGEAIDSQFSRWNLTEAERDVALLLLLKGLSLKEAAAIRATTERTIRAQARAIYAKAGLTGRASLSAFFLEDLLAPLDHDQNREVTR
jgi:DNA-binding CsgD family transcriptional regulator